MRIRSPCHLTGLFILLCTVSVSLSLPGDQAANEHINHHLLIERESGVQSSIQEDVSEIFDVNRLPNGTEIVNSATQYFAGALGAYYSMPRSVIDIIRPGPLPYEQFLPILSDTLDSFLSEDESQTQTQAPPVVKRQVGGSDTQSNIQGNIQEIARNFITWLVPVLVVAVLSLVLAICFPCVGCCFCCCRLCGRCGGKAHRYRSNHQTTKCLIVSIIILLSAVFLLTGIVLGFLSNDKISTAIDSYTGTVDAAIQDGINFVEDTLDEVTFIAMDELDNVLDSITDDINDVANILGNSLEIALEREAQPFIDGTNALLDQLTDLQNGFQGIDAQLSSLSSTIFQLNSSVLELQEALSNISTLCGGDPACLSLIPQSQQIMLEFNENDLNVSDALSTLDNVNIGEIRELVDNATQVFSNISGLLEEEIGEFDLPFNRSQFDSVTSIIISVQDTVDGIIGSNGTIGNIRDILLNDGDNYVSMFNTYRYGVVAAMFVAIFLIWVVYLIGLFCGVFGYSSKAPPYERSHVAHCGARLLLLGTALSFISGGLLLILTSFMYVSSTGMQKICNDLAPPEYTAFQRIFDDRQVWDGRTLVGNILHSQLGIDSNISISIFLRECESNSPLYEALQAESFFDIDELLSNFTNITNELDFSDNDFGSALNLSSSDFLPASTRQDLEALQGDIMNSINFTAYMDYLNENPLSFDLQEVFDNLTSLAALFTANMMEAVANYTLEIWDNLVGTTINATIQDFNEIRNSLVANLTSLNSASQGIGVQVVTVFESLDRFLNRSGTIITNEVDAYIDRIVDYVTSFIDFAVDAIKTEVGRCGSFTAAYTGLHITFCSKTLDGLNGFWFSVGWCAVFLIPLLISGAILTNYIRRSPSDVHSITDADDIGYDDTVISNPTVMNSNQHGVEMVQLPNTPDVRVSHW